MLILKLYMETAPGAQAGQPAATGTGLELTAEVLRSGRCLNPYPTSNSAF